MPVKDSCVALSVTWLIILSLTVSHAQEDKVQLVWDPSTTNLDGTPATGLKGYILYFWQTNWELPERVDVGNRTTYTLTALEAGKTYHFAVTAYDVNGTESGYSNIVITTIAPPWQDTESPTVAMTTPGDGSLIIGSPISISASASDNVGVAGIQFLLNGTSLQNEDITVPFSIEWDTTTVADGVYNLSARARDAAGNQTTSDSVTVTIKKLPPPPTPTNTVDDGSSDTDEVAVATQPDTTETGSDASDGEGSLEIITPKEGDVLAGNSLSVAVYDMPAGAASVIFQAIPVGMGDLIFLGETVASPFLVAWDTLAYVDGDYILQAVAMSSEDEPILTASVNITLSNETSNEADIIEDNGSKIEVINVDEDHIVITSNGVIVEIPAGALATDDQIFISVVDVPHASGILPGDYSGMIVDITTESGQHIFDKDITIRIPYVDDDQDGLIDGTTISETTLTIWFFDGVDWVQLVETEVLADDNVVVGWTDHFTEFGVFSNPNESNPVDGTASTTQGTSQGGSGSGGSSCFIATAAFGSPLEPQVRVLREFRDAYLLTNRPGQWFVARYYQFSPPIADFIQGRDNMRAIVRLGLTPLVWTGGFLVHSTKTQRLTIISTILLLFVTISWVLARRMPKRQIENTRTLDGMSNRRS